MHRAGFLLSIEDFHKSHWEIADPKEQGPTPANPRFNDFDCCVARADGLYPEVSLVLVTTSVLGSRQDEQGGRSICQESAYPAGDSPAIDFLGLFLDRRISVWHVFV
jgi:hypothetical protein